MSTPPGSSSSKRPLIQSNDLDQSPTSKNLLLRDPSEISTKDINLPKLLHGDANVDEQTLLQVEIVNDELARKATRSQLASKGACLTYRWQTILVIGIIILALAIGIGSLAYWISLLKVITQPYSLYGASCYPNSRSCDASRMLWCPAGTCLCTGNFVWNITIQNCSCGSYSFWTGFKCQSYGSYGDPCNVIPYCMPGLQCVTVINQTFTTGQDICACNDTNYLDTTTMTCMPRLTYNQTCKTEFDCEDWIGLVCINVGSGVTLCQCSDDMYWNGTSCTNNALGWEYCNTTVPCDTSRGLTCINSSCQCNSLSYWDNVTTINCEQKKTYSISCEFDFQCNTTVGLSCPVNGTGCNCPTTSSGSICDCQAGLFWDGQSCVAQHSFNGTCPGQYACVKNGNLVCYFGHCICPGNMVWDNPTPSTCACPTGTVWNTMANTCM